MGADAPRIDGAAVTSHPGRASPDYDAVPHRSRILLLFAAVLLLQPIQYAFIPRFGEPYPALTMPSFIGALTDSNGAIRVVAVEVDVLFADSSVATVSPAILLAAAPGSHRYLIMAHVFGPPPSPAPVDNDPSSFRGKLKRLLVPGRLVSAARRADPRTDHDTRVWLHTRVRELFPSRTAVGVNVHWYAHVHAVGLGAPQRSRKLVGTHQVDLIADD